MWSTLTRRAAPVQPQDQRPAAAAGLQDGEPGRIVIQVRPCLPAGIGQGLAQAMEAPPRADLPPPPIQELVAADFGAGPAPSPIPPERPPTPDRLVLHVLPGHIGAAAREVLEPVNWHPATPAARQRVEAQALRFGQPDTGPPITPGQSAHAAHRFGTRMAVRDAVAQAVGRLAGLALVAGLSADAGDDEGDKAKVIMAGAITMVATGLVFGLRAGHLMTRAWRGDGHHPGTVTLLGMGPAMVQLCLVALAHHYGGIPAGMAVTLNIVNRLVSAAVRDGVAQSQKGLWGELDLVMSDGSNLDPTLPRDPWNRDRLQGARNTYLVSSLLLLWLGRWMLESAMADWTSDPSASAWAGSMRTGLPAVMVSVLNEGFDAYQGSWWQAHAAERNDLVLKYIPGCRCRGGACACSARFAREVGERFVSHAGMRQAFGTLSSDLWTTWAEFQPASGVTRQLLRAVAAAANSITTYRGYTVERGRAPLAGEVNDTIAERRAQLARGIADIRRRDIRRRDPLFPEVRARLAALFREHMLEQGLSPQEVRELDAEMRRHRVRTWLDALAIDSVRNWRIADLTRRLERPFHVGSMGDNEFDLVENSSVSGSPVLGHPQPTPPPSLPPSARPVALDSPMTQAHGLAGRVVAVSAGPRRSLFPADDEAGLGPLDLEAAPPTTPVLDTLQRGADLLVNDMPVTFRGWHDEIEEHKAGESRAAPRLIQVASDEPINAAGWPLGTLRGQDYLYVIDPGQFRIAAPSRPGHQADDGMGLPPLEPAPPGEARDHRLPSHSPPTTIPASTASDRPGSARARL